MLISIVALVLCFVSGEDKKSDQKVNECKCVPYFLCGNDDLAQGINSSFENLFIRKECHDPLSVCCFNVKEDLNYYDIRPDNESEDFNHYDISPDKETESCQCVPPRFCQNGIIISNGSGVFDPETAIYHYFPGVCYCNKDQHQCGDYIEACCLPPELAIKPIDIINGRRRIGCGQRNTDRIGLDEDDSTTSEYGEFPWTAAVLSIETHLGDKLNVFQCGGALINEWAIITAAHCIYGVGEWDAQSRDEIFLHQDRNVSRIIIHENFNSDTLNNNIALLVVVEPFVLDPNVDIICLPKQGEKISMSSKCFSSGWGKDDYGSKGKYQVIAKKILQEMVNRSTCEDQLKGTRLGRNFTLHKSFACAKGTKNRHSCQGDGGNPLVCPIPGREFLYEQVGIAAWGIECNKEIPAVYTKVSEFRSWIDYHLSTIIHSTNNNDPHHHTNLSDFKYR